MAPATVQKLERGEWRRLRVASAFRIAAALELAPVELIPELGGGGARRRGLGRPKRRASPSLLRCRAGMTAVILEPQYWSYPGPKPLGYRLNTTSDQGTSEVALGSPPHRPLTARPQPPSSLPGESLRRGVCSTYHRTGPSSGPSLCPARFSATGNAVRSARATRTAWPRTSRPRPSRPSRRWGVRRGAMLGRQNHEICLIAAIRSRTSPSAIGSRRGVTISADVPSMVSTIADSILIIPNWYSFGVK